MAHSYQLLLGYVGMHRLFLHFFCEVLVLAAASFTPTGLRDVAFLVVITVAVPLGR